MRGALIALGGGAIVLLAGVLMAATPGLYDATPQYGLVGHAGVTGTTAGGANAIVTLTGRRRIIVCTNSLNTETVLTYDSASWLYLPASTSAAVDLSASGLTFADGKVIGIYYLSDPSSGSIACTAH